MMKRLSSRAFLLFLSSLFVIIATAFTSKATTAVMLSDREMVINARIILTGRVGNRTSAWDDAHQMIWTYVEVQWDRLLKGNLAARDIVLKQRGGIAGDIGVKVFGEPEFTPGQRVFLYLDTAPDGALRVAQSFMGAFTIATDQAGKEIINRHLDGMEVNLLPRSDGQAVTNADGLQDYMMTVSDIMIREAGAIAETEAARSGEPVLAVPADYDRIKTRSRGYAPEYALTAGGIRWMQADRGQAIIYHLNPASCPVSGGGQAEASRAMSAWPDQSGANIHLEMGTQTSGCGLGFDGQNEVSFGDCQGELPPPTGGCAGIVAMTSVEYSSQSAVVNGISFQTLIEAHTVFARGMDCILGNSTNLSEILCHELGHSIGLAHSGDPSALMWFIAHGNGRGATLGDDDKAGVLVIYPQASGGGGGSSRPTVRKAKVKLSGKLIVAGDNFTPTSQILLNGRALSQSGINYDPGSGRLVFRGALSLGPPGTNVLYVINSAGSSSPFLF